ncbi:MAG: NusA N-terminal domain-containing protein, partial [Elusimicrobiota bacterium]
MKSELLPVLEQIEKEKSIKKEEILRVIENALISAYRKHAGRNVNVEAHIDPETAAVTAYAIK